MVIDNCHHIIYTESAVERAALSVRQRMNCSAAEIIPHHKLVGFLI